MDLVVSDVVARKGGAKEGLQGPPLGVGVWAFVASGAKQFLISLSRYITSPNHGGSDEAL
jgi:hypothetical protein